jgi:hypothetical protein
MERLVGGHGNDAMTYALYAFLGEESPEVTIESLAADFERYFEKSPNFSIEFEQLPFKKSRSLALRWRGWLARVHYEEGARALEDSAEISRILGSVAPGHLSNIDRRVRIYCGDDDGKEFTNQVVRLMEFVENMPGAIVFDPQQNKILG